MDDRLSVMDNIDIMRSDEGWRERGPRTGEAARSAAPKPSNEAEDPGGEAGRTGGALPLVSVVSGSRSVHRRGDRQTSQGVGGPGPLGRPSPSGSRVPPE